MLLVDAGNNEIFGKVSDGMLSLKLINESVPDTIDKCVINRAKKGALNVHQRTENQNLCINSAKVIGCSVVLCAAPE